MRSTTTISGIEFIKYYDGRNMCHICKDGERVSYVMYSTTTSDGGDIRDSNYRLHIMMAGMQSDRYWDYWHVYSVAGEIIYHDPMVRISEITELLFNCFADESDIMPLVV